MSLIERSIVDDLRTYMGQIRGQRLIVLLDIGQNSR